MPPVRKKRRRSPWDAEGAILARETNRPTIEELLQFQEAARLSLVRPKVIRMKGSFICDPAKVTPEDVRQFLWAGLRELRVCARVEGLEKQEVDQLLSITFDLFHDVSEGIWAALKAVSSTAGKGRSVVTLEPPPAGADEDAEAFVLDEDIPALLTMDCSKPLTLIDPDAELLASFEP